MKVIMRISKIITTRSYHNGFNKGYEVGYTDGKSDITERNYENNSQR